MQAVSSRIWTRDAESISNDEYYYAKHGVPSMDGNPYAVFLLDNH